jgi:hypothetical protein
MNAKTKELFETIERILTSQSEICSEKIAELGGNHPEGKDYYVVYFPSTFTTVDTYKGIGGEDVPRITTQLTEPQLFTKSEAEKWCEVVKNGHGEIPINETQFKYFQAARIWLQNQLEELQELKQFENNQG